MDREKRGGTKGAHHPEQRRAPGAIERGSVSRVSEGDSRRASYAFASFSVSVYSYPL
jgi:hypothetical protein